jgi:hypothetical protein
MLLKTDGDKIVLLAIVIGLVFFVGHAQSRFNLCRSMGEKNMSCVFGFN